VRYLAPTIVKRGIEANRVGTWSLVCFNSICCLFTVATSSTLKQSFCLKHANPAGFQGMNRRGRVGRDGVLLCGWDGVFSCEGMSVIANKGNFVGKCFQGSCFFSDFCIVL
jgi:hypothetical protein